MANIASIVQVLRQERSRLDVAIRALDGVSSNVMNRAGAGTEQDCRCAASPLGKGQNAAEEGRLDTARAKENESGELLPLSSPYKGSTRVFLRKLCYFTAIAVSA